MNTNIQQQDPTNKNQDDKAKNSNRNKIFAVVGISIVLMIVFVALGFALPGLISETTNTSESNSNSESIPIAESKDGKTSLTTTKTKPNIYYRDGESLIEENLETGERSVVYDLSGCTRANEFNNELVAGDLSNFANRHGEFYISCGENLVLATTTDGLSELNISEILEEDLIVDQVELSADGRKIAIYLVEAPYVRNINYENNEFYIYNFEDDIFTQLAATYEYSGEPVLLSAITLGHFSLDNNYFYATNAAPAGYLADVGLSYDLNTKTQSNIDGILLDATSSDQLSSTIFAGTENNVAENGTVYFWVNSEDSNTTTIAEIELNQDSLSSVQTVSYPVKTQLFSLADYSTAWDFLTTGGIVIESKSVQCELFSTDDCDNSENEAITILDPIQQEVILHKTGFTVGKDRVVINFDDDYVYFIDQIERSEIENGETQISGKLSKLDIKLSEIQVIRDLNFTNYFGIV